MLSGRTGLARHQRGPAVEVGNPAAQAESGKGDDVVRLLEHLATNIKQACGKASTLWR
jgi:hypothetical protein